MAFRWLSFVRRGGWQSFRKFVLEERKDISDRIATLEKQKNSLGEVIVIYKVVDGTTTQIRQSFSVTPDGSVLHDLCQVYIAYGGNPLDISMFLSPTQMFVHNPEDETSLHIDNGPMNGAVSPMSGSPDQDVFTGGWMEWDKHIFWKVGNAEVPMDRLEWSVRTVSRARCWVEKEIRNKRNKIEEKIIKICDLVEQLNQEIELLELLSQNYSPINKPTDWNVQQSVEFMINRGDSVYWKLDEEGVNADPEKPRQLNEADIEKSKEDILNNKDIGTRTWHLNWFEDAPSEQYPITAL